MVDVDLEGAMRADQVIDKGGSSSGLRRKDLTSRAV